MGFCASLFRVATSESVLESCLNILVFQNTTVRNRMTYILNYSAKHQNAYIMVLYVRIKLKGKQTLK